MPLKICIYEDSKYAQFFPLSYLRPVYLMRAGIMPLYQRVRQYFDRPDVALIARYSHSGIISQQTREYPVNIIKRGEGEVLFLNGRVRDYGDLPKLVRESALSTVYRNGGETVAVLFKPDVLSSLPAVVTQKEFIDLFGNQKSNVADYDTTATLYNYCWDFVADIDFAIENDFRFLSNGRSGQSANVHEGAWLVNPEQIRLDDGVEVMPGCLIDATAGPVYVGMNTRLESHAAIYGPCYIGPNAVVVAGKVVGSSIGHTCRVGGEVEESVFQSYVNKYHAGFIGHSYVGSWVNFGAMTTNSDLKNNYSNIRVSMNGQPIDTGSIKVGSFIGDHTKFGIGTLLNTGLVVGLCCNVFGGSLVSDREVASYSWGTTGSWDRYRFDKAIETARRTCDRRNQMLSQPETDQLLSVFDATTSDEGIVDF